ncbi:MAG: hypothetical protein ACTSQP_05735 [Promethearchaeota archaeon]
MFKMKIGHSLKELKSMYNQYEKQLINIQFKIVAYIGKNYPELYKRQKEDISLLQNTIYHIPLFKDLKDDYIMDKIKTMKNIWHKMNDFGQKIRIY